MVGNSRPSRPSNVGCPAYDAGLPFKPLDAILNEVPGFGHNFHDLKLGTGVKHARHALAIDDERLTFHPSIWDKDIQEDQSMKQVWFCGMHTDVGASSERLSDQAGGSRFTACATPGQHSTCRRVRPSSGFRRRADGRARSFCSTLVATFCPVKCVGSRRLWWSETRTDRNKP